MKLLIVLGILITLANSSPVKLSEENISELSNSLEVVPGEFPEEKGNGRFFFEEFLEDKEEPANRKKKEEETSDEEEENSTKPSFPSRPSEVFSNKSPSKYPAYLKSNVDFSDCKPGPGVKCSIVGIYQCVWNEKLQENSCGMGFKAVKLE